MPAEMPSSDGKAGNPILKSMTSKSVLIEEPESLSPGTSPSKDMPRSDGLPHVPPSPKKHCTSISKRLSGRSAPVTSSKSSLHSISSSNSIRPIVDSMSSRSVPERSIPQDNVRRPDHASLIISQVAEWLQREKAKQATRNSTMKKSRAKLAHTAEATKVLAYSLSHSEDGNHYFRRKRSSSDASDTGLALDALEQILSSSLEIDDKGSLTPKEDNSGSYFPRRKSTRKGSKLLRTKMPTSLGSDSDTKEDENVPSAEVILDNSKALGYSGGASTSQTNLHKQSKRAAREEQAWNQFKSEIVRLTHTLKIPGWRRVSIERGGEIEVGRLSGALTNAVYVVSPPKNVAQTPTSMIGSTTSLVAKKQPRKLLLRIYGPQVEHLIDRESELQILRRLARKQIGPTLLGTFTNGRFEQYFHARTLTAQDLRHPDTSRQIAKRMRELHDGIELLKEEREAGAFVWHNWDKWKERCEEVISWLDAQMIGKKQGPARSKADEWKAKGLICGVEWSIFRRAVRDYRDWLNKQFGEEAIKQGLVFAHNDTQYGNLMRMEPSGESPLLLPENSHKQLQVIDFEYASANVRGLEFANHFTEWCYDYHNASKPHVLHQKCYPTVDEQHRFLKAYVQHRPPIQACPSTTPMQASTPGPSSSISSFVLDSRGPSNQYVEDECKRDQELEKEVERLRQETRIWRIANSAQWVAWGIVQAKVPGMDKALEAQRNGTPTLSFVDPSSNQDFQPQLDSDSLSPDLEGLALDAHNKRPESSEAAEEAQEGEEEHFDYLGYAQERAMFFWGDVLQLGIVKREELPEDLLEKIKMVEY